MRDESLLCEVVLRFRQRFGKSNGGHPRDEKQDGFNATGIRVHADQHSCNEGAENEEEQCSGSTGRGKRAKQTAA